MFNNLGSTNVDTFTFLMHCTHLLFIHFMHDLTYCFERRLNMSPNFNEEFVSDRIVTFCVGIEFWYPTTYTFDLLHMHFNNMNWYMLWPVPVDVRSKAWICCGSPVEDCGFESRWGHGYVSVVSVECCHVEVSATSWSLIQRSPTDCSVSSFVI